ncbi:MAG: barstar family protein [Leadbetterella sp.]
MSNLFISAKADLLQGDAAVIEIDAKSCTTLRSFYETIAEKLHFPDYFGFNLDSLDEMLADLSWIEDPKLIVYVKNTEHFLINERSDEKVLSVLDMLDAICEDWKWIEDSDLGPDDEDYLPPKSLEFAFENGYRIDELLNNLTK